MQAAVMDSSPKSLVAAPVATALAEEVSAISEEPTPKNSGVVVVQE